MSKVIPAIVLPMVGGDQTHDLPRIGIKMYLSTGRPDLCLASMLRRTLSAPSSPMSILLCDLLATCCANTCVSMESFADIVQSRGQAPN